MTKKTNSLLLRYGISAFWQNKTSNHKITSNIIQQENLIYKELFNQNLNVLSIRYNSNNVSILVYNFSQMSRFLKKQIVQYYRKCLSIPKVIKKFGI